MMGYKTIVAVLMFCVVQCLAMSDNELEDFKNYLEKTSALDQTLKDSFNSEEDDEDELATDHAWEESGKFEGDLILSDRQRKIIVADVAEGLSRNGLNDITKRWPNNEVIYYIQREHFSGSQIQAIQDGIDDLGQASCIKFRPYKKGDRDAVVIQGSRRGCFSQVGYQGGYQVLNLSGRHPVGRGCFRHGTVVHELLHTLGFYHMQSSPDRDDYIDVVWENIIEPAKHNFRKYNSFAVTDFGVGYDYESVLHYSRRAFSSNGKDTLVPKNEADIGQRVGLSDKDSQKLNKMYCDRDSNNEQNDENLSEKPRKKQSNKNKPFQGHGIGYHQGKTVVIKLPAAETYKLPDLPSYHIFDYFSKTPQVLSPSYPEGFREEIKKYETSFKDYKENDPQIYIEPTNQKDAHKYNYVPMLPESIEINNKNKEEQNESTIENKDLKLNEKVNKKSIATADDSNKKYPKPELIPDVALDDAFERLHKIIKTHVYPTRAINFNPYPTEIYDKTENSYAGTQMYNDKQGKEEQSQLSTERYPAGFKLLSNVENSSYKHTNYKDNNDNDKKTEDFGGFEMDLDERLSAILKSFSEFDDNERYPDNVRYSTYQKASPTYIHPDYRENRENSVNRDNSRRYNYYQNREHQRNVLEPKNARYIKSYTYVPKPWLK